MENRTMDRIQPVRVFSRVAELKSFTKAAESLGLPKASVSAQVQQLETELGTRLLHRTTRQVQLTRDGMVFYERAKDLLGDVDELTSLFQSEPSRITGRVRIDMSSRMARFEIIPKLPHLLAEFPNLQIELGAADRKVDLVREGYDFVIRGGMLADSALIARKIGEAKTINVASSEYLKKYGTPRSVKDLESHFLVNYVSSFDDPTDGFEYREGDKYRLADMKSQVTVNNAESYVAACEAGLGIIQSPGVSLQESLRAGRLIEILPRLKAQPMPIYVIYPNRRNLPRRVRVLVDWVEKILGEKYR
jgi:DNA-binding transcriptional LysR family regulator